MRWQDRYNATEHFMLLSLEQYTDYCFEIDSYPQDSGGYWSKSVGYCATTGVRGKHLSFVYSVFIYCM